MNYTLRTSGSPFTTDFRIYVERSSDHKLISPWHDIPLYPDGGREGRVVNMVVEIPRFGNAKMEIAKDEFMTPIKQDAKKGALRYIPNIFPYKGLPWNYGAFPQTWEDPTVTDPDTKCMGDDDPLDVCEIGSEQPSFIGQVKPVKVLGALAVIDQGETDWKILAIDVRDPLADKIDGPADIDMWMPGLLDSMKYWFTVYKIPEGKGENGIGLRGMVKDPLFAISLINDTHEAWTKIVYNELPPHRDSLTDLGVVEASDITHRITQTLSLDMSNFQPPKSREVEKSHFVKASVKDVGWDKAMQGRQTKEESGTRKSVCKLPEM